MLRSKQTLQIQSEHETSKHDKCLKLDTHNHRGHQSPDQSDLKITSKDLLLAEVIKLS